MTKEELLTYKDGEKAVEIQEFQIAATDTVCPGPTVYKVTIYSNIKKGFFGNVKYDKYIFPFYFNSKKLVEDFLKYFDYFYIDEYGEYWDGQDIDCLMLKMYDFDYSYYMNDCIKSESTAANNKSQLQENGIWDGYVVNNNDGRYWMFNRTKIYFTDILKLKCIPIETKNIYHYKMTKD